MPNPGRRFLQVDVNNQNNMSATSHSPVAQQRMQRCFVCYNEFTPFKLTADKWESNMIKMFYSALNLPAPDDGGDDDDEDPIISLPFCPQCHSKISVMSSLHGQLQLIQSQFSNIRNDVVFTIVETNGKNCRKGPMDFIRQQIYDKWKPRFDDAKSKSYFDQPTGLEAIATEAGLAAKRNQDEFLYPEETNSREDFESALGLPSPYERTGEARFTNSTPHSSKFGNSKRSIKEDMNSSGEQPPSAKRPARSAATANFLHYNESPSIARIREMESVAKSMGTPAMPKLIPMGMGARGKRVARNSDELNSSSSNLEPTGQPVQKPDAPPPQPQNSLKRLNANSFANKNLMKFGRMKPGPKKQVPAKIKFQPARRGRPGRPAGWRKPYSLASSDHAIEGMDTLDNMEGENAFNEDGNSTLNTTEEADNSMAGTGTFSCRLCPKSYYNISRLRRHESLCHPTTKALQCALCPNGFSSILAFRRHMQNQHHQSMLGITTMTCAICRKSFVKQSAFDYHMTTHESVHHRANPVSGRAVSGHPTKKKPGPKPRARELSPPIVEDDDIPLASLVQHESNEPTEQNEIELAEETADVREVGEEETLTNETPLEPQIKTPAQKKKKTFFSGTRKRRRRRLPKSEDGEPASEVKKEPVPAPDRVIIPRGKKYQNVAPVRKSLRRAESSVANSTATEEADPAGDDGKSVDNKAAEQEKVGTPVQVKEAESTSTLAKKTLPPSKPSSAIKEGEEKEKESDTAGKEKGKKEKTVSRQNSKEPIVVDPLAPPKRRLACPVCGLEYPFFGLLCIHIQGHSRDLTKCLECGVESSHYKEHRAHVVSAHNQQLLSCQACGEGFTSKKHLTAHEILHKEKASAKAPPAQAQNVKNEDGGPKPGLTSPKKPTQTQDSSDSGIKPKTGSATSDNEAEKVIKNNVGKEVTEEAIENSDGKVEDIEKVANGPKVTITTDADTNNAHADIASTA